MKHVAAFYVFWIQHILDVFYVLLSMLTHHVQLYSNMRFGLLSLCFTSQITLSSAKFQSEQSKRRVKVCLDVSEVVVV